MDKVKNLVFPSQSFPHTYFTNSLIKFSKRFQILSHVQNRIFQNLLILALF